MKVLSLFDGISCARVALDRVGIPVEHYFASEIDKYAIQISQKNYPDIIQIGSVTDVKSEEYKDIDLLIGGSPCQDLSIAKKDRKGLDGERSGLFWEYVRILREVKPKWFILENVASMPKEAKETITKELGVEPIMINAALVSAQNRKRLFWTNIPGVTLPEDRGILLKDVLEGVVDKKFYIYNQYNDRVMTDKCGTLGTTMGRTAKQGYQVVRIGEIGNGGQGDRVYSQDGKSVSLSANGGGRGAKTGLYLVSEKHEQAMRRANKNFKTRDLFGKTTAITATYYKTPLDGNYLQEGLRIRKLTPIECERLQGLPEIKKSCIIRVCSDNQKNLVNAEDQNLKSLNVVGNAEREDLKEIALSVEKNLNISSLQTSDAVEADVHIYCEENKVEIHSRNKLLLSVSGAENKEAFHPLKSAVDFAQLVVGLNTIVDRTTLSGEEGLLQRSNPLVVKESGKSAVSLYGKGITQLVEDVKKDSTTLSKLLKSTTLDPFIQVNKEQLIQTLFSCVVLVIFGYIPEKIKSKNTLTFQITSKVGYTFGVSNTQRYKMLGNAFNVDVVAWILSFIPKE